jgi:hypothetical protein
MIRPEINRAGEILTAGSNGYELSQYVEDQLRKRKAGKAGEVEQWRFARKHWTDL